MDRLLRSAGDAARADCSGIAIPGRVLEDEVNAVSPPSGIRVFDRLYARECFWTRSLGS